MSKPIVVLFIPDSSSSFKWSFHPPLWHITMPFWRGGVHTIRLLSTARIQDLLHCVNLDQDG